MSIDVAYHILAAPDSDMLAAVVNDFIARGYSPTGGVSVTRYQVSGIYVLRQAVYKAPTPTTPV